MKEKLEAMRKKRHEESVNEFRQRFDGMKAIGLSLSFCVRDIAKGFIPLTSVTQIITSTKCKDDVDFQYVINQYKETIWSECPNDAETIAWNLWNNGKIDQPRVRGDEYSLYLQSIKKSVRHFDYSHNWI